MQGRILWLEGLNNTGKTTIFEKIKNKFYYNHNHPTHYIQQLCETDDLSNEIRELLKNENSDNKKIVRMFLKRHNIISDEATSYLNKGVNVILDRSIISTLVYGHSNDSELNKEILKTALELKAPDIIVYLDRDIKIEDDDEDKLYHETSVDKITYNRELYKKYLFLYESTEVMFFKNATLSEIERSIIKRLAL